MVTGLVVGAVVGAVAAWNWVNQPKWLKAVLVKLHLARAE